LNRLSADFSCAVVISVITKIMPTTKAHNIHNNAATFVTWAAKLENHKCSSSVICEAELRIRLVIFDMGETIKKEGEVRDASGAALERNNLRFSHTESTGI
jgi:hypothetical protein